MKYHPLSAKPAGNVTRSVGSRPKYAAAYMPQCNHGAHSIILGMRALDMQAAGLAIDSVSRGTEFAYNTVSQSLARSPVLIAAISDNLFGPAVPPSQVPTASLRQVLLRVLCVRLAPQ